MMPPKRVFLKYNTDTKINQKENKGTSTIDKRYHGLREGTCKDDVKQRGCYKTKQCVIKIL